MSSFACATRFRSWFQFLGCFQEENHITTVASLMFIVVEGYMDLNSGFQNYYFKSSALGFFGFAVVASRVYIG